MEFGFDKRRRCLQVLELSHGASEDDIKKAYKSMALRYHPDKNSSPDANVKFQEISAAYNYLMEGDDYLRRIEHEDGNFFDIIVKNLFSWIFNPHPSYGGAFNTNNMYFDDDEDDDDDEDEYYFSTFYRSNTFMRSPSSNMYGRNLSSPHGFNRPSSSQCDFSSHRHFNFTHANAQHGQYFHETSKQAKQHGKSAKRSQKDARMTRKEKSETYSGYGSRATSPPEESKRKVASPSRHNQRSPTPSETQKRKEAKEGSTLSGESIKTEGQSTRKSRRQMKAEQKQSKQEMSEIGQQLQEEEEKKKKSSPTPCETQNVQEAKEGSPLSGESFKTENQSIKKSKKQIRAEQKQREQEMSEIRQKLQKEEDKKKKQAEEKRIAQELKEKAEREAKEEERRRDEERQRIEQEAARQKMEEEKREKAKKAAETRKRRELLKKFESNPFLNDDGSFQSTDSDLMNIIRTATHSETATENSENVESINGIPVSELARLQNLNIDGHSNEMGKQSNDTMQGKEPNQPKTKVRRRSRSRQAQRSATRSELGSGQSPMPNGFTPTSMNFNQANFQHHQQQQPFHQWSQNQRQPTPFANRPYLHQPCLGTPLYQGPTVAPRLPPPQLNRPPPPLRFNYRPSFSRQPSSTYSATRFPSQPYKMNAM